MTPFYSVPCSRCAWVCLLLLVIPTALRRSWPCSSALSVSPDLQRGKNVVGSLCRSCHSTCLSASARPALLQNHSRSDTTLTRGSWTGWAPADEWNLLKSCQYTPHNSSGSVERHCSLRWFKTSSKGRDLIQEQGPVKRCLALITGRAHSPDWNPLNYPYVLGTRRPHPPGGRSAKSRSSEDGRTSSDQTKLRKAHSFSNARVTLPAAGGGRGELVPKNCQRRRAVCTQLAAACAARYLSYEKKKYLGALDGGSGVSFNGKFRNWTQQGGRLYCSLHGFVDGVEGLGDGGEAAQLVHSATEWRCGSGIHWKTWIRKKRVPVQRHKHIQLRQCRGMLPTCSVLRNISDALLPISSSLRNASNLVGTSLIKWVSGEEATACGSSAKQGATQEDRNEHPLGTQRWRFILQRRKWLGFRARDEEEAVEIDFFRDGTAVTEHGITGVWTTTRVGLSLFLFVPCLAETPSPPEESKPTSAERWTAPGRTPLRHSGSHVCEAPAEIAYDVMHLTAHFYWNTYNRTPYMYRGSVTKDRRTGFLPSFIFRPVVATFYGYGINDTPDNEPQTH